MRRLTTTHAPLARSLALLLLAAPLTQSGCGARASSEVEQAVKPFSLSAVVRGATVADVTAALVAHIQGLDDRAQGLPGDWVVAGADQLQPGAPAHEAALKLPGGDRIIALCNHHYASQAMAFGGHHGVALPCKIAVTQQGPDVEVVLLNPEAIFAVFFRDVPAEHGAKMEGMAKAVLQEMEGLVAAGLESFAVDTPRRDLGPQITPENLETFASMDYSVVLDVAIPAAHRGSEDDRRDFGARFVETLLETATHEHMDTVGSRVEGLSTPDWRAARSYALGLPGGVSIVELCSPTYAAAALETGAHHAPALPCRVASWVEGDVLRVHLLDPGFMFPVFFGDAPPEMMEAMGGMASTVRADIQLMVTAALADLAAQRP